MKKIINAKFINFSWMQIAKHTALLLIVLAFSTKLNAQNITATGKVADASGQPMIGTSVMVKGASRGTVTDVNGQFSLQAPADATLVFQYVGYITQELKAGQNMNVIMKEDALTMESVIVAGAYGGDTKRRDATGSVSTINADQLIAKAPVNVLSALQGEMAGVQIMSNSGAPGDGVSVRIRGASTLSDGGAEPLYVVDGVIYDNINSLNPNDIQSMTVLKDAASAALYGSRAANGVIMVTTKSGQTGKPQIDVRFQQSFGYLSNKMPQINRKEANIVTNTIVSPVGKDQFNWVGATSTDSCNIASTTSNDYQRIISRVAKKSDIGLTARGGAESLRYYMSLGYLNETGTILKSSLQRINGSAKVDYAPYKFFTSNTNIRFSYDDKETVSETSIFNNAIRRMPQTILYYPAGGALVPAWGSYPNTGKRNPLIEIFEREDGTDQYSASINQRFEIRFTPHLRFFVNGSFNATYSDRLQYTSPLAQNNNIDNWRKNLDNLTITQYFNTVMTAEAFADYSRTFGDHFFRVMVGTSAEDRNRKTTLPRGTEVISSSVLTPQGTGGTVQVTNVTGYGSSMASLFGSLTYDYKKRYLITGTLRRDGSSRFGPENRWGTFPAASVGWRFNEDFRLTDILENGMLRIGWGITGNIPAGNYDHLSLFNGTQSNGYYNSSKDAVGIGVVPTSRLGNAYIKWERTTTTNYGLDLSFLKGRLSLVAEYYIKKTTDLLDDESIPSELGFSTIRVNIGSVQNKGVELALTAYILDSRDWNWTSSLNWSRNKNTILDIPTRIVTTSNSNASWWVESGRPAGLFYGYKNLGVYAYDASNAYTADYNERLIPVFERDSKNNVKFDRNQRPILSGYTYANGKEYTGEIKKMTIGGTVATGGDVIWDDYNRNGDITDDDKQILGCGYPDWFAGWTNTVGWKNISLGISFYYNKGGLIYNQLLQGLSNYGDNTSAPDQRSVTQGWRFQGHITDWYIPGQNAHPAPINNNRTMDNFYLEDGSFLRLQSINLNYDFSSRIVQTLYLKSLSVYVYANNLLTWTNYRGYDPEVSSDNVLTPGGDNQKYPRTRVIGFGVNIGF